MHVLRPLMFEACFFLGGGGMGNFCCVTDLNKMLIDFQLCSQAVGSPGHKVFNDAMSP